MNARKQLSKSGIGALALVFLLTSLTACKKQEAPQTSTQTGAVTSANLAQKVESARTPADHEALAQYYEQRARVAQREESSEREAQSSYERRWSAEQDMGRRARENFRHMVDDREGEVGRYRDMAEWHREVARNGHENASE